MSIATETASVKRANPSRQVLHFVEFLRISDFKLTPFDIKLLNQSLQNLDRPEYTLSLAAFRSICCQNKTQWKRFEGLFDRYWNDGNRKALLTNDTQTVEASKPSGSISGIAGSSELFHEFIDKDDDSVIGAGRQNTLSKADFRFLNDPLAMREIEVLAEKLAHTIKPVQSRRKVISKFGKSLAICRILKQATRDGGEPITPYFKRNKLVPPRVIILHDVSHSMTFNNPLLIRFSRGILRTLTNAHAFVFHTRLFLVSDIFRQPSITEMRALLEQDNKLWLGGTCIADSIRSFINDHARGIVNNTTTVLIISDGYDSNNPDHLAKQLGKLQQTCKRIFWLNPMLQRKGFNPDKPAIHSIRKHVDHLLPAHSYESLRDVVRLLAKH